ncbi:MAG: hypothetical protein IT488_10850 [Gammaproteobacteria bacterium]|nr:hypothetical protein [Gammaproteobacteria bacterium]
MNFASISGLGASRHPVAHSHRDGSASARSGATTGADGAATSRCRGGHARTSAALSTGRAFAMDMSHARSLQLEITTAEGDRVTLTLSDARSLRVAASQTSDGSSSALAMEASLSTRGNIAYSVEGELSAEESAAIDGLLTRVDELAGRFFSGDIAGLFEQMSESGFNMEGLASFSLQMDMTRNVQATAAYRSVQAMAGGAASENLPGFMSALGAARESSAAGYRDLFDGLLKAATELLSSASDAQAADAGSIGNSALAVLERMLSTLDAAQPAATELQTAAA